MSSRCTTRLDIAMKAGSPARAGFDVVETQGDEPGPVVVVIGGVHGDEVEGAMAAGRLSETVVPLRRGILRVVPICNEQAFRSGTRETPQDGLNLARVFPGNANGSITERLAALVAERVLAGADVLIDLHTAGRRYDMPLMVGYHHDGSPSGDACRAAAFAFGGDLAWEHPRLAEGRTTTIVSRAGGIAMYAECPGGRRADPRWVDAYLRGVLGVLTHMGMVNARNEVRNRPPPRLVQGGGDLDRDVVRARADGLFLPSLEPGQSVNAGGVIGLITDIRGRELEQVCTPVDGVIMFLRRETVVLSGDVVAALADREAAPPSMEHA